MNIALMGLGGVGFGLVNSLASGHAPSLTVVGVVTRSKGSLYDPTGLSPQALLDAFAAQDLTHYPHQPTLQRGLSAEALIAQPAVQAVVEITPTNLKTGQPALDYCRQALTAGKHLVTANKGPVALAWQDLHALAQAHKVGLGIEATVMSGTPIIHLAQDLARSNVIDDIRGIFNGTSNYILTQMARGEPYAAALAQAQRLGYAETDPTADVEGHDVVAKLVIMANSLLGGDITPEDVDCQGITALTPKDIQKAADKGMRWKLIGEIINRGNGECEARVAPQMLPLDHPLAGINGATNAVTLQLDPLGAVTLSGPGAGRAETGAALVADLLRITEQHPS